MQKLRIDAQLSVESIVQGVITCIKAAFGDRILSIYAGGSLNRAQLTPYSDIDLTVVFKDVVTPEEEAQFLLLREGLEHLSPLRLDMWPQSEVKIKTRPASETMRASRCLFGEDFMHAVPVQSLDFFTMQSIHKAINYMAVLRGRPLQNPFPLDYPDSEDSFFGYLRQGDFDSAMTFKKGTRIIVDMVTRCTTALLAIHTETEAQTKQDSIDHYAAEIGGKWQQFVVEIYDLIKHRLHYQVPQNTDAEEALRTLLAQLRDFENDALSQFRPVILANLKSDNARLRKLAVVALKNVQFTDDEIRMAVDAISGFDDEALLDEVKQKLLDIDNNSHSQ